MEEMRPDKTEEDLGEATLKQRVAEGDETAIALHKKMEEEEARRKQIEAEAQLKATAEASLDRAREKAAKSRKVKTGVCVVGGATTPVFEQCTAEVINYVQDHGGDVQSIDFGLTHNSQYIALIQYTVDIDIASTVAQKVGNVQAQVKHEFRKGVRS